MSTRGPVRRSLVLSPVLGLAVVAGVLAGVAAWAQVPAWIGVHGGFVDLSVYRYGGRTVLHGLPLYADRDPATGLLFTYPPFAAVAMVPLALLPAWLVTALWTAASVLALAAVVRVVLRGPGWLVAVVTAGALALEPVWQNLTFAQINLILMPAVLVDVLRPERRWSGVLLGIAAGVKLTPLVFVVLLLLAGRRATAGRALLAFAGTAGVGFLVTPASAVRYWTDGLTRAGRVGPPEMAHNQSVFGALARLLGEAPSTPVWIAVAGPLALAAVVLGAVWWRRGDRVLGAGLGGLAMLIASPVSWSHHWVWAVPVGLALWERHRAAGTAWAAVFLLRPFVCPPWGQHREYGWGPAEHVAGNAYLLAALVVCGWAAMEIRRQGSDRVITRPGGAAWHRSPSNRTGSGAQARLTAYHQGFWDLRGRRMRGRLCVAPGPGS